MHVCIFLLFIYLQHALLHPVIPDASRKLCHIYSIYIFADLFTVYALIARLQFSVVNGVGKIGKLF